MVVVFFSSDVVDHQSRVQNAKVAVVKSKKRTQKVAFGDDVDDLINEVIAKERRMETGVFEHIISDISIEYFNRHFNFSLMS